MTGTIPDHTEPIAWTRIVQGRPDFLYRPGPSARFHAKKAFAGCWPTPCFGQPAAPASRNGVHVGAFRPRPRRKSRSRRISSMAPAAEKTCCWTWRPRKGLDHPLPGIVWIHGGAWQGGNKGRVRKPDSRQSRGPATWRSRSTTAWRPSTSFPRKSKIANAPFAGCAHHANELHVDPDRIGVVGSSAGAHLAMMFGAMDSADGLEGKRRFERASSKPQVVVSFAGPTNLRSPFPTFPRPLIATFLGGTRGRKARRLPARLAHHIRQFRRSADALDSGHEGSAGAV